MKTIKEQIENRCIHFTGLMSKKCAVGLLYENVKEKDAKPIKLPCFKNGQLSGSSCEKTSFPDADYVEKEIKEIQRLGTRQIKVYTTVKKHIENTGEKTGKVECPACGGDLHYLQVKINGHIWGKCNCGLSWME